MNLSTVDGHAILLCKKLIIIVAFMIQDNHLTKITNENENALQ